MTAVFQLVSAVCGFFVPRLMIGSYGSEAYGTIVSITTFLGVIAFGEAGVGSVIRAAMYKPLAEKDHIALSAVWAAGNKYFTLLSKIYVGYGVLSSVIFGLTYKGELVLPVILMLCLAVGIEFFIQYYVGYMNVLVLISDQRVYIVNFLRIITILMNLVVIYFCTLFRQNIVLTKSLSMIVYSLVPILVNCFVSKKYNINKKEPANMQALSQKWSGMGHHIAFYVYSNVGVFALTSLTNSVFVSIYAIYYLISSSLSKIISVLTAGTEAAFGNMIARKEGDAIRNNFAQFETILFFLTAILYGAGFVLLLPFVKLYTKSFTDADYIKPLFGYLLLASSLFFSLRSPYEYIIAAAGHFRETRTASFIEAGITLVVTFALVPQFNLNGAAIGRLVGITYRMIVFADYVSKNIIFHPKRYFYTKTTIVIISVMLTIAISALIFPLNSTTVQSYREWLFHAAGVTLIACIVSFFMFSLFYMADLKAFTRRLILVCRRQM